MSLFELRSTPASDEPEKKKLKFSHAADGIDHINIYSKARTEIGRYLSNFARMQSTDNTEYVGLFQDLYQKWILSSKLTTGEKKVC